MTTTTDTPPIDSPGKALDFLLGQCLTNDDLDPDRLPAWSEPEGRLGLPGTAAYRDSDLTIRCGRNWAGHMEVATPWFPEEGGPECGWVVYTWATMTSTIVGSLAELALR